MKTRNELIEEVVEEFGEEFAWYDAHDKKVKTDFLRDSLLKISDASMDMVEVKESVLFDYEKRNAINSARTASQQKRAEWVK